MINKLDSPIESGNDSEENIAKLHLPIVFMKDKHFILKIATDLGFSQLGVASLQVFSEGFQRYQSWLKQGYQGSMAYLERGLEKREDLQNILPQARSIICLSWNYNQNLEEKHQSIRSPFISRYAWQDDYHLILKNKLKEFEEKLLEEFPESQFKSYVDTGPVQEKYWASLAGLGWIGKHTNLIHPREGSYFFLASILTTLSLPEDESASDHCGRCQSCIDICPTQAIVAPYVLDARRCISYLTIENKGPIPHEFRQALGTHVFGCDDCQEVCPWNREAKLPEEFLRNVSATELTEWLSLDEKAFKERFKNSPILRSKRRGFLRNVCVVLGNLRKAESIPALQKALHDSEPLIRSHAAWALGQWPKDKECKASLQARSLEEANAEVLEEITLALQQNQNPLHLE